ncbi:MAG: TIGR04283 family arsenosugar biosynthesis glycosyltransferase [Candidatus Delongbacteria bacterium]|jgi:rSAM/selenodomain-associated transferase 2/rSAM/selenodomain-associated transferase 1|nr:TIGR04283 family arsenosugar biosynthesis glycosyltransferase [Candidatus Delongbacteria bacterium]
MNNRSNKLIIFSRFPTPGKTKTRLIPDLGKDGAASLQKHMTEFTVTQARSAGIPIEVRYTDGSTNEMKNWLGNDLSFQDQGEGDLGEKMSRAFKDHFDNGVEKVVIIGSDCPDIRKKTILECFRKLQTNSCVFGPAVDGGYYMIGLTSFNPELFSGIDWGTKNVLSQSLSKLIFSPVLLDRLNDVDEIDDIPKKISVVIPALNEQNNIKHSIRSVLHGFNVECIVVDGGSTDNTSRISNNEGATVVQSEPGRATQMNTGAKAATGDILLFLHADSILPDDWDIEVRSTLAKNNVSLGAFRLRIDGQFAGKSVIEFGINYRSKIFKSPYGDQGLFVSKETFDKIGGFPEIPLLEDVRFVKSASKIGSIKISNKYISTSGRRWIELGALNTTVINQLVLIGSRIGIKLESLKKLYRI